MLSTSSLELLSPIIEVANQFLLVSCLRLKELPDLVPLANGVQTHLKDLCSLMERGIDIEIFQIELKRGGYDVNTFLSLIDSSSKSVTQTMEKVKQSADRLSESCTQCIQSSLNDSSFTSLHKSTIDVLDDSSSLLRAWDEFESVKLNIWLQLEPERCASILNLIEHNLIDSSWDQRKDWLLLHVQRTPLIYQALREHLETKYPIVPSTWSYTVDEVYPFLVSTLAWLISFPSPPPTSVIQSFIQSYSELCKVMLTKLLPSSAPPSFHPQFTMIMDQLDSNFLSSLLLLLPNLTHSSKKESIYSKFKFLSYPIDSLDKGFQSFETQVKELDALLSTLFSSIPLSWFLPFFSSSLKLVLDFSKHPPSWLLDYFQQLCLFWEQMISCYLQQCQALFLEFQVITMAAKTILKSCEEVRSTSSSSLKKPSFSSIADMKDGLVVLLMSCKSSKYTQQCQTWIHQFSFLSASPSMDVSFILSIERMTREFMAELQLLTLSDGKYSSSPLLAPSKLEFCSTTDSKLWMNSIKQMLHSLEMCFHAWLPSVPLSCPWVDSLHSFLFSLHLFWNSLILVEPSSQVMSHRPLFLYMKEMLKSGFSTYQNFTLFLDHQILHSFDQHYYNVIKPFLKSFTFFLNQFHFYFLIYLDCPSNFQFLTFAQYFSMYLHYFAWNGSKVTLCFLNSPISTTKLNLIE